MLDSRSSPPRVDSPESGGSVSTTAGLLPVSQQRRFDYRTGATTTTTESASALTIAYGYPPVVTTEAAGAGGTIVGRTRSIGTRGQSHRHAAPYAGSNPHGSSPPVSGCLEEQIAASFALSYGSSDTLLSNMSVGALGFQSYGGPASAASSAMPSFSELQDPLPVGAPAGPSGGTHAGGGPLGTAIPTGGRLFPRASSHAELSQAFRSHASASPEPDRSFGSASSREVSTQAPPEFGQADVEVTAGTAEECDMVPNPYETCSPLLTGGTPLSEPLIRSRSRMSTASVSGDSASGTATISAMPHQLSRPASAVDMRSHVRSSIPTPFGSDGRGVLAISPEVQQLLRALEDEKRRNRRLTVAASHALREVAAGRLEGPSARCTVIGFRAFARQGAGRQAQVSADERVVGFLMVVSNGGARRLVLRTADAFRELYVRLRTGAFSILPYTQQDGERPASDAPDAETSGPLAIPTSHVLPSLGAGLGAVEDADESDGDVGDNPPSPSTCRPPSRAEFRTALLALPALPKCLAQSHSALLADTTGTAGTAGAAAPLAAASAPTKAANTHRDAADGNGLLGKLRTRLGALRDKDKGRTSPVVRPPSPGQAPASQAPAPQPSKASHALCEVGRAAQVLSPSASDADVAALTRRLCEAARAMEVVLRAALAQDVFARSDAVAAFLSPTHNHFAPADVGAAFVAEPSALAYGSGFVVRPADAKALLGSASNLMPSSAASPLPPGLDSLKEGHGHGQGMPSPLTMQQRAARAMAAARALSAQAKPRDLEAVAARERESRENKQQMTAVLKRLNQRYTPAHLMMGRPAAGTTDGSASRSSPVSSAAVRSSPVLPSASATAAPAAAKSTTVADGQTSTMSSVTSLASEGVASSARSETQAHRDGPPTASPTPSGRTTAAVLDAVGPALSSLVVVPSEGRPQVGPAAVAAWRALAPAGGLPESMSPVCARLQLLLFALSPPSPLASQLALSSMPSSRYSDLATTSGAWFGSGGGGGLAPFCAGTGSPFSTPTHSHGPNYAGVLSSYSAVATSYGAGMGSGIGSGMSSGLMSGGGGGAQSPSSLHRRRATQPLSTASSTADLQALTQGGIVP